MTLLIENSACPKTLSGVVSLYCYYLLISEARIDRTAYAVKLNRIDKYGLDVVVSAPPRPGLWNVSD